MRNIYHAFFLTVFFCAISCYSPPHKIEMLNDAYLNKQPKDYKSLLLVFTGTAVDRTILENLGVEMTKKLKKKNIVVTAEYFGGETSKASSHLLQLISKKQADALILFTPLNGAVIKEYYGGLRDLETRQITTRQRYDIRLYDIDEKPVWGARLNLHIYVDSRKHYSKIADKIILHMYENALLRK